MGKLKEVYTYYKESNRGYINTVNLTKDWYNAINESNYKDNSVLKFKSNTIFEIGKIYKFKYIPILKDKLLFYDLQPLILYLGIDENNLYNGINLNLLPIKFRENFLDKIYTKFYREINREIFRFPMDSKKQSPLSIKYDILEKIFKIDYFKFAYRTYYFSNMKNITVFSYENWYRILYLEDYKFKKQNVKQIYKLFNTYFKNKSKIR